MAVTFPDVEAQQITYLKAALAARGVTGVAVTNYLPAPIPAKCVLVRDDGGPRLGDVRAVARMGYRVWSGTDPKNPADSFDLANLVSALVADCADGNPVVRATSTRPFSVDDPSGRPTHYLTAELIVRGSTL